MYFFSKCVQTSQLVIKTPFMIMRDKQPFLQSDSAYTKSTSNRSADLCSKNAFFFFLPPAVIVKRSDGGQMTRDLQCQHLTSGEMNPSQCCSHREGG